MSSNDTDSDDDRNHTYSTVRPQCPICGSTHREQTAEDVPASFDRHFVRTTCGDCGTRYCIEFRPIDISWSNPGGELHSAVSQGLLEPQSHEYCGPEAFPKLPPVALLEAFEWPLFCDCGEVLTGNHVTTGTELPTDDDEASEQTLRLRCPACGEDTVRSADRA